MRRATGRWLYAVMALLLVELCVSGARAADEQVKRVALQTVPLAAPQQVLSRPQSNVQFVGDMVWGGGTPLALAKGQDGKLSIGGEKLIFTVGDDLTITLRHGDRTLPLVKKPTTSPSDTQYGAEAVTLTLKGGREYRLAFPYAMAMKQPVEPGEADLVHGTVVASSGQVQQIEVDGAKVALYDHNADGFYRILDDSIGIVDDRNPAPVFAPIGQRFATGKAVYELRDVSEDGAWIEYAPFSGQTALLDVSFAMPQLRGTIVIGSAQTSLNAVVSSSGDASRVALVPGLYSLQYGAVYSAEMGRDVAIIAAGKMPLLDAASGAACKLQLGGPLTMSFEATTQGGNVTIDGASVLVSGTAGEEYTALKWTTPPEVSVVAGGERTVLGKMEFG